MTKTHLITGAGSGIGAAVADRLRARGDHLMLVARSEARAADLERSCPGSDVLVADLADPAALEGLLGGPRVLPDRLDSVLHVAGVVDLATVAQASAMSWRAHLDVNLVAPALLTQACLPALRAARGTVVFVNSSAGLTANPNWSAYAASKFGLRALADALRAEEADEGVRVTTIFPSRTATAMQQKVHSQEDRDYDADQFLRPDTVADAILHGLDLPRDGTIPDLTVRPVKPEAR